MSYEITTQSYFTFATDVMIHDGNRCINHFVTLYQSALPYQLDLYIGIY